jgi:hypothetical protein
MTFTTKKGNYVVDIPTMTLYKANGEKITRGYFHIAAIILRENLLTFEKYDYDGNYQYGFSKGKSRAMA